jgi:hypothetical protein
VFKRLSLSGLSEGFSAVGSILGTIVAGGSFIGLVWVVMYAAGLPGGLPDFSAGVLSSIALPISLIGVSSAALLFTAFGFPGIAYNYFGRLFRSPAANASKAPQIALFGALAFVTLVVLFVPETLSVLVALLICAAVAIGFGALFARRVYGKDDLAVFYLFPAAAATYMWLATVGLSLTFLASAIYDSKLVLSTVVTKVFITAFFVVVAAFNVQTATQSFRRWFIGAIGPILFGLCFGSHTLLAIPFRSVGLADYETSFVFSQSYMSKPGLAECVGAKELTANATKVYILSSLGNAYIIRCGDSRSNGWLQLPKSAVAFVYKKPDHK